VAERRAIVLADGTPPDGRSLDATWPGWRVEVRLVIAADGGARLAGHLGLAIDHWVGDGDSLDPAALAELRAAGVAIELVAADKDESDTELAIRRALALGATDLTILGALGGPRLDHALANIGLLAHPSLDGVPARILDPIARVTLIRAPRRDGSPVELRLEGRPGDLVSLLALGDDVDGVTTQGLQYPLRNERLRAGPARGLSNVRLGPVATVVATSGRLLVVESPATLSP